MNSKCSFGPFFRLPCQRAHACVSSAVVQLVPAPCRDLTARATRSFILKGPWGWTPAAWDAVWWKWVSTHHKNISLALWDRGRRLCFFLWLYLTLVGSSPLHQRSFHGATSVEQQCVNTDVFKYSLIHPGYTCLQDELGCFCVANLEFSMSNSQVAPN